MAARAGVPELAASSLKAALDRDWDDPAARDLALAEVLGFLERVEAFAAGQVGGEAAAAAVATARQVRDQDVDLSGPAPALRRGVARDRRISVEDGQMRHGRKSRSVLFDGYKRHVLRDLDSGLIPAVGITPASTPEASVTPPSPLTWTPPAGRWPSCTSTGPTWPRTWSATAGRAWRPAARPGGCATRPAGMPRTDFALDFTTRQLTCPAGMTMAFEPGRTVHFPKDTCTACPLRQRCTTSSNGRSVSIHPDEALLAELRQRQQTPASRGPAPRARPGRARPRTRRALAGPPRPLPRHPQEPARPQTRRRSPQPPRHRTPAPQRQPAGRLTTT